MAVQKTAHLVRTEQPRPGTRLLELEVAGDEPLGFLGGQYIIVDTGLSNAAGRAVKRAYSILSADSDQRRFQLAVLELPEGPGSGFMHRLEAGAALRFSGPWGRLAPVPGASTLLVATDTGITAALGMVRSERFAGVRSRSALIWLREEGAFLPEPLVRSWLPAELGAAVFEPLPPRAHPERPGHTLAVVQRLVERLGIERVLAAGDGGVNYALLDALGPSGLMTSRDDVESFFNMPKKSEAVDGRKGA